VQFTSDASWREVLGDGPGGAGGPPSLTTSYHHFQVADALLCQEIGGRQEVVMASVGMITLYRLHSAGGATRAREVARHSLGFGPYSIARSPCGRVLAAGGDDGLLSLFWLGEGDAPGQEELHPLASMALGDLGRGHAADAMNNSLRFGTVAGRTRLLVANQDAHIYVFEVPEQEPPREASVPPDLTCRSLYAGALGQPGPAPRRVDLGRIPTHDGFYWEWHETSKTDVIGPLDCPVNCAVPSPDGRFIAAVGDSRRVSLLEQAPQEGGVYAVEGSKSLTFSAAAPKTFMGMDVVDPGCQYCAWNSDSTLLAVSSDSLRAVYVWQVASGALVAKYEEVNHRPCLALQFMPWDPQVLAWAEESSCVHLADVGSNSREAHQALHLPRNDGVPKAGYPAPQRPRRRITGLAVSPSGTLFVSTKEKLLSRGLLHQWTTETHRLFPESFQEAVKTIVAGAGPGCSSPGAGDASSGLDSLPEPLLHNIIHRSAFPLASWHTASRPLEPPAVVDGLNLASN